MPLSIAMKYTFINISRSTLGFFTKLGQVADNFVKNNLKPIHNVWINELSSRHFSVFLKSSLKFYYMWHTTQCYKCASIYKTSSSWYPDISIPLPVPQNQEETLKKIRQGHCYVKVRAVLFSFVTSRCAMQ